MLKAIEEDTPLIHVLASAMLRSHNVELAADTLRDNQQLVKVLDQQGVSFCYGANDESDNVQLINKLRSENQKLLSETERVKTEHKTTHYMVQANLKLAHAMQDIITVQAENLDLKMKLNTSEKSVESLKGYVDGHSGTRLLLREMLRVKEEEIGDNDRQIAALSGEVQQLKSDIANRHAEREVLKGLIVAMEGRHAQVVQRLRLYEQSAEPVNLSANTPKH